MPVQGTFRRRGARDNKIRVALPHYSKMGGPCSLFAEDMQKRRGRNNIDEAGEGRRLGVSCAGSSCAQGIQVVPAAEHTAPHVARTLAGSSKRQGAHSKEVRVRIEGSGGRQLQWNKSGKPPHRDPLRLD